MKQIVVRLRKMKKIIAAVLFCVLLGLTLEQMHSAFADNYCADKWDCFNTYSVHNCNWCASSDLTCGFKITAVGGGFDAVEDWEFGYWDWEAYGEQLCLTLKGCVTTNVVPCVHVPHEEDEKVCVESGPEIIVNAFAEGGFADPCG